MSDGNRRAGDALGYLDWEWRLRSVPGSVGIQCEARLTRAFMDSVVGDQVIFGVPVRQRAGVGVQDLAISDSISTVGYSKGT